MPGNIQRISACLWFDHQAEEAANFYTSIFDNSGIDKVTRYGKEAAAISGRPEGSVLTVVFRLDGLEFTALNGGPMFKFSEAISFVVHCDSQDEVDHFWDRLSAGGDPDAQRCGWLKDRYGVSWQIVPGVLIELMNDPDPEKAQRVTAAMLEMKKIDIEALRRAHGGRASD